MNTKVDIPLPDGTTTLPAPAANPYRPLHGAPSAALAWQRTPDFLRRIHRNA